MHNSSNLTRSLPSGIVLIWAASKARNPGVTDVEERVFRVFNSTPGGLHPATWTIMQSGSLGAVFVATATQYWRRGQPWTVAVTGTTVWATNKAVKRFVGRGRPDQHLDAVVVRGAVQSGSGFPSGHAAVATTLAIMTTSTCPMRGLALGVAAVTAGARIYVGAHLPLDVVGGAAIGVLGSLVGGRLRRITSVVTA